MSFSSPRTSSALSTTPAPEANLPSAQSPTSWSFAPPCGRPSMLRWPSPPSASIGQCLRTSPGPASSVDFIENGKLRRTSCTQGSSLACPWPSRLSTGTPDSAKPRDADSCSFSFLPTSTMHTSPTGPRAKGPGSRPFGT